jgi:hypothetical protein
MRLWLSAKSAAFVRLDEDELEVVEQVLASVEVMENRQELELVLEGLEASVGNIPRLNLEKYATFVEEEYRLLRQQKEGEAWEIAEIESVIELRGTEIESVTGTYRRKKTSETPRRSVAASSWKKPGASATRGR